MSRLLLKGDASGIQDFVFNVKSEGAARSLKSRSYFVHAICQLAYQSLSDFLIKNHFSIETIYIGGGNFFAISDVNETIIQEFSQKIEKELLHDEIAFFLSWAELSDEIPYNEALLNLSEKSVKAKLQKYKSADNQSFNQIFEEYQAPQSTKNWDDYTTKLIKAKGYEIVSENQGTFPFRKFGFGIQLKNEGNNFEKSILNKLPLWDDILIREKRTIIAEVKKTNPVSFAEPQPENIIEFKFLSAFANERTGTEKLGILKLDVDNLGSLFGQVFDKEIHQKLSKQLSWFFDEKLLQLIENETFKQYFAEKPFGSKDFVLKEKDIPFKHQLYVVFSGGDDCFMLGAWDAIIEFAVLLRKEFDIFQRKIQHELLPNLSQPITFSAAIEIVDEKYPVKAFANDAEEALDHAKNYEKKPDGTVVKDKISIIGHVFSWEAFEEIRKIESKLLEYVLVNNFPRTLLFRLQELHNDYLDLLPEEIEKHIKLSLWSKFRYLLREFRNRTINENLSRIHENTLKKAFIENEPLAIKYFPMAARLVELKTKK